jgi:hypothetical protein
MTRFKIERDRSSATSESRQSRTCGVVLASGRESADHQRVDTHLFLLSFDGESAVQAFAHA